jgi:hypothetical protein
MPEQNVAVTLVTPHSGYRKHMFFNRVHVRPTEAGPLVQFGFVHDGALIDCYQAVLTDAHQATFQAENLKYLERLNAQVAAASVEAPWAGATPQAPVCANFFRMSYSGHMAEMVLLSVSTSAFLAGGPKAVDVEPDAIAILRSDLATQLKMIKEIYASADAS